LLPVADASRSSTRKATGRRFNHVAGDNTVRGMAMLLLLFTT
jgi:hypothetical protein